MTIHSLHPESRPIEVRVHCLSVCSSSAAHPHSVEAPRLLSGVVSDVVIIILVKAMSGPCPQIDGRIVVLPVFLCPLHQRSVTIIVLSKTTSHSSSFWWVSVGAASVSLEK